MPLYFAYGANMDGAAMARRCPASRPLGPASLAGHRFFIMTTGFASVRRERGASVHGLLWDLALSDVPALDRFEEVARGLYTKAVQPVLRAGGPRQALLYIGTATGEGTPQPGYMEPVLAAAEVLALPVSYRAELRRWLPQTAGAVWRR